MEILPAGQFCWESAIMMLPSPACPALVMRMCVVILDWQQSGKLDIACTELALLFYCHCVDLVGVGGLSWLERPPVGAESYVHQNVPTIMYENLRMNLMCEDVKGHVQRYKRAAPAQRRCLCR